MIFGFFTSNLNFNIHYDQLPTFQLRICPEEDYSTVVKTLAIEIDVKIRFLY